MKKLSIITICYNEPNLEETCESIVNQTWQDFEWIVVDGGSNKETLDIFEKYKNRIDKFISEPDNGRYDACNKGINLASSEFVNFLNAGDSYYSFNVLQNVFSQNFDNVDIIYGEQEEVFKNSSLNTITKCPDKITKEFFIYNNIHTPAMFIRKEQFIKHGLFSLEYEIASDREKWIVFAENYAKFKHINTIIAKFDKNGISSDSKYKNQHEAEIYNIIQDHFTSEEIEHEGKKCKKLSFLEQLFSITNSSGKTYKIITFLGIHFKIRRHINA